MGITTALLLSGGPRQHVAQGGVLQEGQGRECLKTLLQNDLKLICGGVASGIVDIVGRAKF